MYFKYSITISQFVPNYVFKTNIRFVCSNIKYIGVVKNNGFKINLYANEINHE